MMETPTTLFTTTNITESTRMLHTPGDFAKKNLLYVQEVGKLKSLQPHKSQRENLDSFLFMGVLEGKGTITIRAKSYLIKTGDCVLINCKDYYAHESSKEQPWSLMWVHFNGISAEGFYTLFLEKNDNKNIFHPDEAGELEKCVDKLMSYQKDKDLAAELKSGRTLIGLLNLCLFNVMSLKQDVTEDDIREREQYKKIREYVNEHYKDQKLMQDLAERSDISEAELNRRFLQYYGIELCDYILNRRFTAAKELLRFTIMPEKEIISISGICNSDLFRRLFLDSEGMSPEEYRMKWSQWVK